MQSFVFVCQSERSRRPLRRENPSAPLMRTILCRYILLRRTAVRLYVKIFANFVSFTKTLCSLRILCVLCVKKLTAKFFCFYSLSKRMQSFVFVCQSERSRRPLRRENPSTPLRRTILCRYILRRRTAVRLYVKIFANFASFTKTLCSLR